MKNVKKTYAFYFLLSFHLIGGVMTPFFTEWGGLNFTQIMILQSWFIFWAAVLSIPCGALADTWGRKPVLVVGTAICTLAPLVYGSKPGFCIFLLGEVLFAAAIALTSESSTALVYDSLREEGLEESASQVFGQLRVVSLVAILVASPIGGFLAGRFGLQAPMLFLSLPFLGAFLVSLFFREPVGAPLVGLFLRDSERETFSDEDYLVTLKRGFQELRSQPVLQKLALDFAVVAVVAKVMLWLYQPVLLELGVKISALGVVHAAAVGAEIAVILSFGALERWLGSRERVLFMTAFAPGLAFLAIGSLCLIPSRGLLTLAGILIGTFTVMGLGLSRDPLFADEFNKRIPSEQRATTLATISMLRHVLSAVLSPIVGAAADWSLAWCLTGLGAVLTIFVVLSRLWMHETSS